AADHEDPEYAQRHLDLLHRQDFPPLPASTVATPTTVTFAPSTTTTPTTSVATVSIQMKDVQSARTHSAWGGYTPTTPTAANAYSINTPTSTTATVVTATPIKASVEPFGSTSSAFDAFHASSVGHNRINSTSVVDMTIPVESRREFLEPAAPQDYSSFTSATSNLLFNRNENHTDDDDDDKFSVVSSRNGSDLIHSESKPRLFPSSINTSTAKEGGLATTFLLRWLVPHGKSGAESNSTTPRASISNDYLPSRSMDSTSY
ncbi:hypothetical protein BGW39_002944, partial [Mortierella sp. 14UC]